MSRKQVIFLRGLRGAPASILLALSFTGDSLTPEDLAQATGYTDKPLSRALATLEFLGLIRSDGRAHGYSYNTAAPHPLFPAALLGGSGSMARPVQGRKPP